MSRISSCLAVGVVDRGGDQAAAAHGNRKAQMYRLGRDLTGSADQDVLKACK
jgi:hypothetical protein